MRVVPGERHVRGPGAPFYPQTEYHCGPAALATVLRFRGADVTPEALAEFDQGCLFFYFGATDLVQHMFWRDRDPQRR